MDVKIKVLLIEDNPNDVVLLQKMLQKARVATFEVEPAETLGEGLEKLTRQSFDIILLDLSLSDSKGLETFQSVLDGSNGVPVIILSGLDDETLAVKAVHAGAQDYLVKGRVDAQLLSRAMIYSIERTQARDALTKAEEKYRSIFENAVEGIFQTSPDGHYLSANPALTRIYGYDSPEELMSHLTDIEKLLYVDPHRRNEFIRQMQENDLVTDFESEIYRKDGTTIWISENVRSVRDARGQLLYYEGTVEDITVRKRIQEQLHHSEALYHSLVETLPQNIFRKDLFERFTFANKRFCETLGRPLSEIIGKTDFDFFPPDLAKKYQKDDRRIMEIGEVFETVEEHQPPSGDKIYVQVVKTPLYDSNGALIGMQGIFWDITARKRAEERERIASAELTRSQTELRRKNEMLEDDLKMAHEIQQAILPQEYPTFPHQADHEHSLLRFCHRYQPSGQVGGDFFNVFPLSETKAGIFICDVMGHGVRSALVTAMVRALVEELRPLAGAPGELMTRINSDLRAILQQTGTPLFTTAFYLLIDLETRQFSFANAGHPKPFLLHRKQKKVETFVSPGKPSPALGLFQETNYPSNSRPFEPGDAVILFTDGVFEIEGPENVQYSQKCLMSVVEKYAHLTCSDLFDKLLAEIAAFSESDEFSDDVCLVGVEVADQ